MTPSDHTTHPPLARLVMAFAAVYLIWGSTYLAIRISLEGYPPLAMAGFRFLLGGLLLFIIAKLQGATLPSRPQWRTIAIIGMLMVVGGTGSVIVAEQWVSSGLAALLVATMPFWLVLIDWLRPQGVRPTASIVMGLLLGFSGLLLLVWPFGDAAHSSTNLLGSALVVFGALSWASGSIFSRQARVPGSQVMTVGLQMLIGGVFLSIASLATGEMKQLTSAALDLRPLLALIYQIIFGSLAYTAYFWLLKHTTPAKAGTYAFVNPVVAVMLGALLADEELTFRIVVAAAIIVTAVAVITIARAHRNGKLARQNAAVATQPARISIRD